MIKQLINTDYIESINGLKSVCPICVKSRRLSRNNAPRDRYTHAHKQCEKGLLLSNFTWSMIRLQGFRTINLGYVKNPRWRPLLKIAKPSKSTFSPEPLDIIGYKFDWNINGTLVLKIMKIKKKHSRVRSQWPTLCLQVQCCSNANISRKRECILFRFDHNGP